MTDDVTLRMAERARRRALAVGQDSATGRLTWLRIDTLRAGGERESYWTAGRTVAGRLMLARGPSLMQGDSFQIGAVVDPAERIEWVSGYEPPDAHAVS
jgi:hypothetical protein